MALWGNKDNLNIGAAGTVYISSWTHDTDNGGFAVTGSGTTFTNFAAGDVIRFGDFKGTYFGDAVISNISSNTVCYIASTEGLDPTIGTMGPGWGATTFVVSELPLYTTSDSSYKEPTSDYTKAVYSVDATNIDATSGGGLTADGAGWVGVTTYTQSDGTLRCKSEILVAMSGIATGGRPKFPTPLDLA
tara:strand:- start:435 stop:1001 length:567 start_codon:yes stop_codon:yes gene_type:complete